MVGALGTGTIEVHAVDSLANQDVPVILHDVQLSSLPSARCACNVCKVN